jgi:hypothetical protein
MWVDFARPARFAVDPSGNVAVVDGGPKNSTVIFGPSGSINGGAIIDHRTPVERRFVAVEK